MLISNHRRYFWTPLNLSVFFPPKINIYFFGNVKVKQTFSLVFQNDYFPWLVIIRCREWKRQEFKGDTQVFDSDNRLAIAFTET